MREIPLTNGGTALVDDEWYERLAAFKWHRRSNGYAGRTEWRDGKSVAVLMHRVVIDAPEGQRVDHINRVKMDNTRSNLRFCTNGQNIANSLGCRGRKSPFKGTDYRTSKKRWRASINVDNHNIHLGYHDTAEAAARAYDVAALKYFGEFACLNFAAA